MTDDKPKGAHQLVKEARAERAAKQMNDMSAELRKAINACGKTDYGVLLLQHLEAIAHIHDSPATTGSTGDINENKLYFNLGRQSVYLDIRKLMDRETRIRVEYPEEKRGKKQ